MFMDTSYTDTLHSILVNLLSKRLETILLCFCTPQVPAMTVNMKERTTF